MMYTDKQWRFVYQLYCEGYALGELAEWLGIHRETIRRSFERLGIRSSLHAERDPLDKYRDHFNSLGEED